LCSGLDDVEVAEQDVVLDLAAAVLLLPAGVVLALGEEPDQPLDLGDAPLQRGTRGRAVVDVDGAEAEAEPARLERDQEGAARELLPRGLGFGPTCRQRCRRLLCRRWLRRRRHRPGRAWNFGGVTFFGDTTSWPSGRTISPAILRNQTFSVL
jgi:hypothetical protein